MLVMKKKWFISWRALQISSAFNPLFLLSRILYPISPCFISIFPTNGAPRAHILACGTAALHIYNLIFLLHHSTLASNTLLSNSLAAFCFYFFTLAQSLSFIYCLSIAQACFSLYQYCCYLFLLPASLVLSSPRLLSLSFFLLSIVYCLF